MPGLLPTRLLRIQVQDFRCFPSFDLEPEDGVNVITGPNGSGKSSLLEAIYLLGTFRSFRMARSEHLIRKGAEAAAVAGEFRAGDAPALAVRVSLDASGRRAQVGSKPPDAGHFHRLPMVLFHPGQLDIVYGPPDGRRRFLDRILVQTDPTSTVLLRDVQRTLRIRNRLIKQGDRDDVLTPYEERLGILGAELMTRRAAAVERIAPHLAEAFGRITDGETCGAAYAPDVPAGSTGDDLARILRESRERDRRIGATMHGPHRDDVAFTFGEEGARRYASHGQVRAIVLALKMAEVALLLERLGRVPLLLLDDVSSELDPARGRRMMAIVAGHGGQVFITTPQGPEAWSGPAGRFWRMEQGQLR